MLFFVVIFLQYIITVRIMKKRFLLFSLMMAMLPLSSISVYADSTDVDLEVGYLDPDGEDPGSNRTPILIPHLAIDGYTLYFYTPCDGCILRLSDENDNVVYSTVIPTGTSSLVLPSYLSGDYKIEIIQGFYCFWGYIEL